MAGRSTVCTRRDWPGALHAQSLSRTCILLRCSTLLPALEPFRVVLADLRLYASLGFPNDLKSRVECQSFRIRDARFRTQTQCVPEKRAPPAVLGLTPRPAPWDADVATPCVFPRAAPRKLCPATGRSSPPAGTGSPRRRRSARVRRRFSKARRAARYFACIWSARFLASANSPCRPTSADNVQLASKSSIVARRGLGAHTGLPEGQRRLLVT